MMKAKAEFSINEYHTPQRNTEERLCSNGLEAAVQSWEDLGPNIPRYSE